MKSLEMIRGKIEIDSQVKAFVGNAINEEYVNGPEKHF